MGKNSFLASLFTEFTEEHETLSDDQKMFIAVLSGAASALVSSLSEYAMICQQSTGEALSFTAQKLMSKGVREFYRGFMPTAWRDGKFTVSYLFVAPLVQHKMMEYCSRDYETIAALMSGTITGVGATLVTQLWDVMVTHIM